LTLDDLKGSLWYANRAVLWLNYNIYTMIMIKGRRNNHKISARCKNTLSAIVGSVRSWDSMRTFVQWSTDCAAWLTPT